mgnify:CR=1 FL=1
MQKIVKFYKEVKQEGLKITWPTKPEVITTTIMVFIFVILASIFFLLVDKIVSFLVELLLFSVIYAKLVYSSSTLWN